MKSLEPNGQLRKIPHYDETINNFPEDNCLRIVGICFFLDSVRHIRDLGDSDK